MAIRLNQIRHKYSAKRVELDGIKFASKKEAKYYKDLLLRQANGEIIFFLRQTFFHLPGGVKYVCDFMEFHKDGTVHFVDTKGFDTPTGKTKRRLTESIYPIKIELT